MALEAHAHDADMAVACAGPYSGSGSNGEYGAVCLNTWNYYVYSGRTYTFSTCDKYSGDPYLKVTGCCTCKKIPNAARISRRVTQG